MRYFVRYHYRDKTTGPTVFFSWESINKFIKNYLRDPIVCNNPLYYSIEDTKEGHIWDTPLFWR